MTETMYGQEEYKQESDRFKQSSPALNTKYWIFALSKGRWVDIGYESDETTAYATAYSKVSDKRFEIVPIKTTNIALAHQRFKAIRLERGENLDAATSLISRKPAMEAKKNVTNDFSNPQKFKTEKKKDDNEHLYKGDIF